MKSNKSNLEKSIKICIKKYFKDRIYQTPEQLFINKMKEHIQNPQSYKYQTPLILTWQITSNCNLRCKHCYYYNEDNKYDYSQDLPTQRIFEIIDEIDEMGIIHIELTGGEPFLRDDIFKIIQRLKSKNISVRLSTNGLLIDKNIAKRLSETLNTNMDSVQISLDGASAETHEELRGTGTFDKTIQGIKNLTDVGIPTYINSTITNQNVTQLTDLYSLAQKLKVKKISFSKIIPREESHCTLIPDMDIFFTELANAIKLENKNQGPFLEIGTFKLYNFLNNELANKLIKNHLRFKKLPKCYNLNCHSNNRLAINRKGKVYLCFVALDLDLFPMGDLKEGSLMDIWGEREDNELFKERNIEDMICKECSYVSLCKAGCPLNAYLKYKTVLAPDSNCKHGEELFKKSSCK